MDRANGYYFRILSHVYSTGKGSTVNEIIEQTKPLGKKRGDRSYVIARIHDLHEEGLLREDFDPKDRRRKIQNMTRLSKELMDFHFALSEYQASFKSYRESAKRRFSKPITQWKELREEVRNSPYELHEWSELASALKGYSIRFEFESTYAFLSFLITRYMFIFRQAPQKPITASLIAQIINNGIRSHLEYRFANPISDKVTEKEASLSDPSKIHSRSDIEFSRISNWNLEKAIRPLIFPQSMSYAPFPFLSREEERMLRALFLIYRPPLDVLQDLIIHEEEMINHNRNQSAEIGLHIEEESGVHNPIASRLAFLKGLFDSTPLSKAR